MGRALRVQDNDEANPQKEKKKGPKKKKKVFIKGTKEEKLRLEQHRLEAYEQQSNGGEQVEEADKFRVLKKISIENKLASHKHRCPACWFVRDECICGQLKKLDFTKNVRNHAHMYHHN